MPDIRTQQVTNEPALWDNIDDGNHFLRRDWARPKDLFPTDTATLVPEERFYRRAENIAPSPVIGQLGVLRVQITQHWRRIQKRFHTIGQRQDSWDEYGSKRPNRLSLDHALSLVEDLLKSVILAGYLWLTPFISSDEDGHITIEWYKGKHELHIEVRENEAEYIKVWGANIESEMHVDFLSKDSYLTLWEWLLNG